MSPVAGGVGADGGYAHQPRVRVRRDTSPQAPQLPPLPQRQDALHEGAGGGARPFVGLHTDVKPLLSRSTTGKFLNSPPKYLRAPKNRPR
eukprot:1188304-Prorocentrum_minimum.AAC.2